MQISDFDKLETDRKRREETMEQTPRLSVILPTYKRPETLRRTLGYLAEQDLDARAFEVIVIEDGATKETEDVIENIRDTAPYAMKFLQNQENRGPGYTQNRGIREAIAPVNLILADDIFLSTGALRAHLELHDKHPEPGVAVLGMVIQSPELFSKSVFLRHWDQFGMKSLKGAVELPYYLFWGCNVSFKRDFMLKHGMFLEHRGRSGGAAHEDTELGYRLHQNGMRLNFSEDAWGYHYHIYTLDQAMQRYHDRGMNWDEFRKFMPDGECGVRFHVLNRSSLREYLDVFRRPNSLRGLDRYLSWHLLFHSIRFLLFNRVTVPLFWRPFLRGAENNRLLALLMHRQIYRAFLYYHFIKGIADAKSHYGAEVEA